MVELYQCWKDKDGLTLEPVSKSISSNRRKKAVVVYRFFASSWTEAMRKHYFLAGFGTYIPSDDNW